jgi:hypothetical protein
MSYLNIFHSNYLLNNNKYPLILIIGNYKIESLISEILKPFYIECSLLFSINSTLINNPTYYDTCYNSDLINCLDYNKKTLIIFDNIPITNRIIINNNFLTIVILDSINIIEPVLNVFEFIFINRVLDICELARLYNLYFNYVYSNFIDFYNTNITLPNNTYLILSLIYNDYNVYIYCINSKDIDWDNIIRQNLQNELDSNLDKINKLQNRNLELYAMLDVIPNSLNKKIDFSLDDGI